MMDRYHVPEEEDYEPGSNGRVLKNLLGIKDPNIIEALEEQELIRTGLDLVRLYDENHQFTAEDICNIHQLWLANIYAFAGNYRNVFMSKGGFPFANSNLIPGLMHALEIKYLAQFTPCKFSDSRDLALALGMVHVELILIHPFREGNGRVARLLANMMAAQAGRPLINYSLIDRTSSGNRFDEYISSIHQGQSQNYDMIQRIFIDLLESSQPHFNRS